MQPRRPLGRGLALVAAALLLCVPLLSSCGFNKLLDKPYTQADGTNYRAGSVYVLNAVVVAAQSGSGTLIASLTNQSDTQTMSLAKVAGSGGNTVTASEFAPVSIAPMGFVNLADDDAPPITLSGSFAAGDVIPLSMTLGDGSEIDMDVPVVYACQSYAGLDASQESLAPSNSASAASSSVSSTGGSASALPSTGASTAASEESAAATPGSSDSTEPSASGSPTAYTCGTTGGTGGRG